MGQVGSPGSAGATRGDRRDRCRCRPDGYFFLSPGTRPAAMASRGDSAARPLIGRPPGWPGRKAWGEVPDRPGLLFFIQKGFVPAPGPGGRTDPCTPSPMWRQVRFSPLLPQVGPLLGGVAAGDNGGGPHTPASRSGPRLPPYPLATRVHHPVQQRLHGGGAQYQA